MIFGFGRPKASPVIRPADMADAYAIAEIHALSFDRPWGLMEFERLIAEASSLCHTMVGERHLKGFVLSRLVADEAEILSIAVHPRHRGEGIAGRLLSAHREALMLNRIRTLFLEVEDSNTPAIALYNRQGFVEVSRRNAYYRKKDGSAATALVMRRGL